MIKTKDQDMEKIINALSKAAKENDKILKINTLKLCNLLDIRVPNEYRSDILSAISARVAKIVTQENATLSENDLTEIRKQIVDAKRSVIDAPVHDLAEACTLSEKPLYGMTSMNVKNSKDKTIDILDVKTGQGITIDGTGVNYSNRAASHIKLSANDSVMFCEYREDMSGSKLWTIETNDAIFTNDKLLVDTYYSLKYPEIVKEQENIKANLEQHIEHAKEFLSSFTFPAPFDEWETFEEYPPVHLKPNGSFETNLEALHRWNEDRDNYFTQCTKEVDKLFESCIDQNVPIIVVPDTCQIMKDVNQLNVSLMVDGYNGRCYQSFMHPGDILTLPQDAQVIVNSNGEFLESETKIQDTAIVYGSISGETINGKDNILLTNAGVIMSSEWKRELHQAIEKAEKERFVEKEEIDRN